MPHMSRTCFAADSDGDGALELFTTERVWVDGEERRTAIIADLDGPRGAGPESCFPRIDTLASGSILCPLPGSVPRFLVISDSLVYGKAHLPLARSKTQIFVENYARESDLGRAARFDRALTKAAAGETLNTANRLSVMAASGAVLKSVGLSQRVKTENGLGLAFASRGRSIGIVASDGGTQDSDLIFALVDLPRLRQDEVDMRRGVLSPGRSFRGIEAIDLDAGVVSWSRPCGASPRSRIAADLNDDGLQEMLVVTYSPENGASGGGATDRSCGYVLCIDEAGSEIWRYRLSGRFTDVNAAVADVLGDEEPEVVVASSARLNEAQGEISILSRSGRLIRRTRSFGGALGLCVADLNGDARCEIIFGGSEGRLFVLDEELEITASHEEPMRPEWENWRVTPVAANDIDGDGSVEIVAVTTAWNRNPAPGRQAAATDDANSDVIVFGPDLRLEARLPLPRPVDGARVVRRGGSHAHSWMVVDVNDDGLNDIVLTSRNTGGYVLLAEDR